MLCAFCPRTIWATSMGFCRIAQNRRRTKCTEHASKKIRSSDLDIFFFFTIFDFCLPCVGIILKKREGVPEMGTKPLKGSEGISGLLSRL